MKTWSLLINSLKDITYIADKLFLPNILIRILLMVVFFLGNRYIKRDIDILFP